ncbi:hypothetical protein OAF06_04955 [Akkermansiaceae bacterium]|nr:hypothetical protein [Akkermansiaceae bacterium]
MIRRECGHGAEDAEVIGAASDMGKEVANGEAALTAILKLPRAGEDVAVVIKDGGIDFELGLLPVFFFQEGLGVEAIDVRDTAIHVEEDDVLRFRLKMRRVRAGLSLLIEKATQSQ